MQLWRPAARTAASARLEQRAANLVFDGGTLQFTGASSQRTDRNFTINSTGGTIDASGSAGDTIGISGSSTIASGSPSFTLTGTNVSNNTLSGVLSGALSLTKSGAGTWIVTGANTYGGGTTISGGTLLANNTSGSGTGTAAITVNGPGTFGGTGTVSGNVTVNSGAALSPGFGAATAILTLGGNLTFASGATYTVNLNGTTAGTNYDQTAVSGTITLASATLSLSLGYAPTIGDAYTIIKNNGAGAVSNIFNNLIEGASLTATYSSVISTFKISYVGGSGHDVVLTCSSTGGSVTDDYTKWHYSTNVYINTKEGGANISTDQSNFPLLVRLTSANFNFNQAQSGGQDIRFAKSTGVHFPYQIERWDNVNDVAEIWVLVDVIKGYNDAQYIQMFWGNSNSADSSNSSKVFATSNNFAGVWHLKEDPSGGSNAIKDATGNANNGTSTGSMTTSELVSAVVGNGVSFNGTSQGITVPDAASLDLTTGVTVSGWFNASGGLTTYAKIADKSFTSNGAPYTMYCLGFDDASHIRGEMDVGGTQYTVAGTTTLTTGNYFYGTFTFDNSTMKLFLNGVQEGNTTSHAGPIATDNVAFSIGLADYSTPTNYFSGTIDEVEVSNVARSADWISSVTQRKCQTRRPLSVQENYSNWAYSQNLYLNTTSGGANVAGNVDTFPVLVRLDTTVFNFAVAQDSGQDIRFAKSDGTHLYYQIEKWDFSAKTAAIWVRVDTVFGNNNTQYITMYWGNPKVNSMSNGAAVFDTGNGFVGVYHMMDGSGSMSDATANGLSAAANGSVTYQQSGDVGLAGGFTGNGTYFDATNNTKFDMSGIKKLTISAWVNRSGAAAAGAWEGIASKFKWYNAVNYREYCIDNNTTNGFEFHVSSDGTSTNESTISVGSTPTNGVWYHVAGMMDGSNMYLFVNGSQKATGAKIAVYGSTNADFKIGEMDDNTSTIRQYWNGLIDEVRIEHTNRSANWINLCYQNQKPGQSLVVFNNENYALWADSQKINLNTSQSGANVATNQINFPTLIRLTSSNFTFSQAQDNGGDIRFASSLGNQLSYQIERWSRSSQLAEIWVNVDTVKGYNGTQYITMYWGNPGVASRSNGAAVFDTANGYQGVWHLGEGSGNVFDATANGIMDTAKGTIKYNETGAIANCDSLIGSTSYLVADNGYNTLLNMHAKNKVTISAWVNRSGAASGNTGNVEGIAGKYKFAGSVNYREYCISNNATSGFAFDISTDGTSANETVLSASFVPTIGTWYYVAGVMDATNMTIFVNGVQKAQTAKATISATTTAPFKIGLMDDDGSYNKQYFNGLIDEVTVGDTNRSADWIKLCYQNQQANQTLVDLDDYSKWAYSKKIYINTATMGLNSFVTKFPLLVRLNASMINFNEPQSNGADIRFSKADGTHFYYEKEQWDQTNQKASIWVLVDTVFQNNGSQYIKMYWGNASAVDKSNSNAVFDTANGFVGVWHFTPESGTDTLRDATVNGLSLTNVSSTPITTPPIALGRTFNGSSQRCYANDATPLKQTGNLTLSAWINPAALPTAGGAAMGLVSKATAEYRFTDSTIAGGNNYLYMTVGGTRYASSAATGFAVSTWYHAAATLDAAHDSLLFFTNGAKLGTTNTSATGAPASGTNTLNVGDDQSSNWFNGSMDEVRIEKVLRNPDWINLCYNTQNPAQTATQTDTASEIFSPLGVGTTYTSGQLTAATIATHNWTIKFDATNYGGGIYWMSSDSLGSAANQLDTNLFTVITDGDSSSKGTATLQLLDSSNVFVRLLQQRTIGKSHPLAYSILYTILGSGKAYVRVSTYASSAVTPTGGLEFRIGTNAASNITNYYPTSSASSCNYLLHSNSSTNPSTLARSVSCAFSELVAGHGYNGHVKRQVRGHTVVFVEHYRQTGARRGNS